MSVIKRFASDIALAIFINIVMPVFCILLMLAVALSLGLVKKLNDYTECVLAATVCLIMLWPFMEYAKGDTWLKE